MTAAPTSYDQPTGVRDQPTGVRGRRAGTAYAALPWALLAQVLCAVAVVYALLLQAGVLVTGALVATTTVLGAVSGLTVRDSRDRVVSSGRALGDGVRRLGRALWH